MVQYFLNPPQIIRENPKPQHFKVATLPGGPKRIFFPVRRICIFCLHIFFHVYIYIYTHTRFPWGAELYLWCAGHGFCRSQHLGLLSLGKMSATQRPDDHREPFEFHVSQVQQDPASILLAIHGSQVLYSTTWSSTP